MRRKVWLKLRVEYVVHDVMGEKGGQAKRKLLAPDFFALVCIYVVMLASYVVHTPM